MRCVQVRVCSARGAERSLHQERSRRMKGMRGHSARGAFVCSVPAGRQGGLISDTCKKHCVSIFVVNDPEV